MMAIKMSHMSVVRHSNFRNIKMWKMCVLEFNMIVVILFKKKKKLRKEKAGNQLEMHSNCFIS